MLGNVGFWGHLVAAFSYAALAIWVFHRYGSANRQQIILLTALAVTAIWGLAALVSGTTGGPTAIAETFRNLAWLGFMFFLLRSGEGRRQPPSISMIYLVLLFVLLGQPVADLIATSVGSDGQSIAIAEQTSHFLRMIYAAGALVLVHNLYTVSAPETRWGISLPMAALAAIWTYDLNLYVISYLMGELSGALMMMRGLFMAVVAPVFVMALRRNSDWRLRLSRSVAFQSVSLLAILLYMGAMILLTLAIGIAAGSHARIFQIILIVMMSVAALLVLPSRRFRAWLNVAIAKNFFKHRYDYRAEWMRFADTIGFPNGEETVQFQERVIRSLADIFDSPAGLLIVPGRQGRMAVDGSWNWDMANIPGRCMTEHSQPFFESTGHILVMDDVRQGGDGGVDPRAVPQWLVDDLRAWIVVPLIHFGRLEGLVILARPYTGREMDWEDLDILRVAGRQLASYLAEAANRSVLAENREFAEFNHRFAFVMHDIKNLVSQLSLVARNSEKYGHDPEFQADMVATLRGSVDKMKALLERLSHHEHGGNAKSVPVDIGKTIMKAVHSKRLLHPIEVDMEESLVVSADPARVETILGHLVQNAIEATLDSRPIAIRCNRQGIEVAIAIIDQGVGMSEAFVSKRLFKPFVSTKDGGFGIGAYEARALAISMGGRLEVESVPGRGTKFTLVLPLAERPAEAARMKREANG